VRAALLLLALGACGGPLSGARLESVAESQRRALLTITIPAVDRTDAVVRRWTGDLEGAPLRALLFALHGVRVEASAEVAGERPVAVSAVVANDGAVAAALAFTLRGSMTPRDWLESLGEVRARSGPFVLVARTETPRPLYGQAPRELYFHVEGAEVIVSSTLPGLQLAGPAARAARQATGGDLVWSARPRAWPRRPLAAFAAFVRGQTWGATEQGLDGRFFVESVTGAVTATATGAELRVRAPGAGDARPALDPALADERAAALGALDCRPPLPDLAAVQGTCTVAVDTTNEVWSEARSYPLRAGARAADLLETLAAALRGGRVPGAADLPIEKVRFSATDRSLSVDRVLGERSSSQTRHAAAVHGGPILHDRFAVPSGRLLLVSGPRADERLAELGSARPARPIPPELERALASGRGRAGFLFLDLSALWKPYLKAAQVVQSPLAELMARDPALVKRRRPLVVTLEPGATVDATVTMPPDTVTFLLAVAAMLFAP
jgi:hypothetical protein